MHTALDIPYWESIAVVALGIRVMMLPMTIMSSKTSGRMAKMNPEMLAVNEKYGLNLANAGALPADRKMEYVAEQRALMAKYNCYPMRAFLLPMFQVPVSICAFMGIREMGAYFPTYLTEGTPFWITNLAIPDPYYVLPVINAVLFLGIIELGKFDRAIMGTDAASDTKRVQARMMKQVMRGVGVLCVPVTATMPAGLLIFWIASSAWNLGQTAILNNEAVKQKFLQ
jgi:YidC/Oxa1 family membrane protein insertase